MDNKIQGEYAMKAGSSQPIFMKAIEIFGNHEFDVRKVETTPKERVKKESRLSSHPLWRTNT
jgi:hypothetical protein